MKIDLDTRQAKRLTSALNRAPRAMNKQLLEALRLTAKDVAQDTRRLLRQNRRGPSQPGQPPARVTGLLAKSIRFRRARSRDRGALLAYNIFAHKDTFYARFLELGAGSGFTRQLPRGRNRLRARRSAVSWNLEPRPFLTKAREDNADVYQRRVAQAIQETLKDIAK